MLELRQSYHPLLRSPAQLALCRQPQSEADLLAALRTLWGADEASDTALLKSIDVLNRETLPDDVAADMARIWLPRLYRVRGQRLQWCLPDGAATEPFHDEYLIRCWQSTTLNLLITPTTAVQSLVACAVRIPRAQPAGFIFHLSRCGSTLLSGCLSELDDAVVLSESPVLTEVLVDPALSPRDKRAHVQCLIDLKASLFPGRRLVVKWNAWDIFQWALLRGLYPAVPVVALVRGPMEILASYHALAGRHMSGDPSLACVASVFSTSRATSVLDHRIGVLEGLLQAMGLSKGRPPSPASTIRSCTARPSDRWPPCLACAAALRTGCAWSSACRATPSCRAAASSRTAPARQRYSVRMKVRSFGIDCLHCTRRWYRDQSSARCRLRYHMLCDIDIDIDIDIDGATPVCTHQSHPEDAAFLSALFALNCTHLHALGLPAASQDAMVAQQYAFRRADYRRRFPSAKTVIAQVDQTSVGQMMAHDDGTVLPIVDVAVAPSMCGRGYVGALLRQVQTQARRDRRQAVALSVAPMNQSALCLYLALGFETVETHAVQWRMSRLPGMSAVDEEACTGPLSIFPTMKG